MRIGEWLIDAATGLMARDGKMVRLEAHTLRLLLCLAEQPGALVSTEALLEQVWPDSEPSPDAVHEAIGDLRIALGDDPLKPDYIASVRRKGYKLIAAVSDPSAPAPAFEAAPAPAARRKLPAFWWQAGAALALIAVAVATTLVVRKPPEIAHTVAVMPIIDLTNVAVRDPFAQSVTGELIARLAKVPGLGVAPPAASLSYLGKPVAFGEFASALNVAYVVDGSMRKQRGTVTFAARLTRASDGAVVWSRNEERPWDERTIILDEVAAEIGARIVHPPQ